MNAWNALGKVKLAADDVWHVCDLEVWDEAFPATVTFYGKWYYRSGTGTSDRIKMNKTLLDSIPLKGLRTGIIRRTMAHEFGHALGIDDHSDSKWIRKALMYKAAGGTNADIQTPQAHDKKDYNDRW